jgi:ribosomal protein S21
MGLRMRVGDGEPIGLALRRFKKLLARNGLPWLLHPRWYIKPGFWRRRKRYRKWVKARQQTLLDKRAGLQ